MGESSRSGGAEFVGELADALGRRGAWEAGDIGPADLLAEVRRLRRRASEGECIGTGPVPRPAGLSGVRIVRFHPGHGELPSPRSEAERMPGHRRRGPWVGHPNARLEGPIDPLVDDHAREAHWRAMVRGEAVQGDDQVAT